MCYAFITYYPRVPGFDQCVQMSEYDVNCPDPNSESLCIVQNEFVKNVFIINSLSVGRNTNICTSGRFLKF